jgi:predicted DNA-binding transcriptional regulator AlpA
MNLITVKEAAKKKGVSVKSIYYAISEERLTRHEQYGKVLVDEAEIDAYTPRGDGDRPSKKKTGKRLTKFQQKSRELVLRIIRESGGIKTFPIAETDIRGLRLMESMESEGLIERVESEPSVTYRKISKKSKDEPNGNND